MANFSYTIWRCEDESIYTVTAFKIKDTSSIKEIKTYHAKYDDVIITFFDPSLPNEINAQRLNDIAEQLLETC